MSRVSSSPKAICGTLSFSSADRERVQAATVLPIRLLAHVVTRPQKGCECSGALSHGTAAATPSCVAWAGPSRLHPPSEFQVVATTVGGRGRWQPLACEQQWLSACCQLCRTHVPGAGTRRRQPYRTVLPARSRPQLGCSRLATSTRRLAPVSYTHLTLPTIYSV